MTIDNDTAQRFPLSWPNNWKRTPWSARGRAKFSTQKTVYGSQNSDGSRNSWKSKEALTVGQAMDRLNGELRRLGARQVILSSNLRVRQDGLPYSQQAKQLDDPGVAVYFKLGGKPRVLACDKWASAAENIAAIAGHISAIRAVDRYGVGTIDQAFAGYAALPPDPGHDWRLTLGFRADELVSPNVVDSRFKQMARTAHPDTGGSLDAMTKLNVARDAAMRELGA